MLWRQPGLRGMHEQNTMHTPLQQRRSPYQHDQYPPIAWQHAMDALTLEAPPARHLTAHFLEDHVFLVARL